MLCLGKHCEGGELCVVSSSSRWRVESLPEKASEREKGAEESTAEHRERVRVYSLPARVSAAGFWNGRNVDNSLKFF